MRSDTSLRDHSGNYTDRAGAGRTDHRLFCSRRNWSCPDQCGAYNSAQHCPSLFFGKGDGRSYHYFQLSDVRIFSFWKEHCQHLGHYGRCCFVCEISWYFFKTLSVCRSVRHQSFPYYDTDDAYRKISCAGLSYAVTAFGTGYRLCAAAFVYPCALRPSGIFSAANPIASTPSL